MNIRECKHCKQKFDISNKQKGWMANHSRWCDKNPKRNDYNKNLEYVRSFITEEVRLKNNEAIKKAHADGKYEGSAKKAAKTRIANGNHLHSEETKQLIKEKALASNHRRLKRGIVEYKGILLDSSWELALAKRLDELNIKWCRPDPIPWVDEEGITHNYFPDFYLPEHNKYLDPKNKHAIKVQENKLKILLTKYKNIDIIDSLEGCRTFNV
jgi:ribosomal protein S18